ncbi:YjgB family protein [Clostridium pasteurianum]|uniref:DUF4309 domain-containing protein n=1 Tax=Clostridium pasteurianum BC1 TaxID=86416 RepID=R4K5N0_CLOPA|nr:YjgB family protein [Clostridium pasteurianum]AGK98462.1 hypothetical protein Clopa_3682 [Clostridium pasteurianum BC1]
MFLFNKKSIVSMIIILALILMVGCSNSNKDLSNNSLENKTSNNISNNNATNTNTTSNTTNNSVSNNTGKSSENILPENQKWYTLLDNIIALSKQGKVFNSDFPAKDTNIDSVESKWGKADNSEWVASAKGLYSTYSKHNIVFGSNKGGQIFEVRSLDKQLGNIYLSMVKDKLGTPQHDVKVNGEEIIGYKMGNDFKILFVFPEPTNQHANPIMSHYSVLYPAGTVNNMAGDPGREW